MNFNAKIESINIQSKQMVVEYFDPHGDASLRLAMSFAFNSSQKEIIQQIIDNTPHKHFHDRYEEKKHIEENNISLDHLNTLVGQNVEYKLPTFDNEVI
jgi:hypothetical protein